MEICKIVKKYIFNLFFRQFCGKKGKGVREFCIVAALRQNTVFKEKQKKQGKSPVYISMLLASDRCKYGGQIKFFFTKKDVKELLDVATIYPEEVRSRVGNVLYMQMEKYGYLFGR